ncbi:MAG: glycosyltransferase family 39 protein [Proteobacteria bacterium]|nr:glycosyltransferase family 39 protein [Pseudomonadota bacterium]
MVRLRAANPGKVGAAIFALALGFRLLMMLWLSLPAAEGVDESEYVALGQNLRLHGSFSFGAPHGWGQHGELNAPGPFVPTAARPPLYPLLIASLWWGDEPPFLALRLAQAVLGALVAWLVYALALNVAGAGVAVVAGLGMALAPTSSALALIALSETLFTALFAGCLWLWGEKRGLLSGLLLGAATLVRPITLVLVPLVGCAGLMSKFNRAVHLRIALAAMLVIVPWTIRNAVTQHAFIPVATYGWGSLLFYSTVYVPYGSGNPFPVWFDDKDSQAILASSPTIELAERRFGAAALARIEADPGRYVWSRVKEFPRNFLDHGTTFMSAIPLPTAMVKSLFAGLSAVFVLLSACGLYLSRQNWRRTYFIALAPLILAALQFVGTANVRYSLPLVPPLMVFAAMAVWRVKGVLLPKTNLAESRSTPMT